MIPEAFAPAKIGLLFTHKNCDVGRIQTVRLGRIYVMEPSLAWDQAPLKGKKKKRGVN